MPSSRPEQRYRDILAEIAFIFDATRGMSFEVFKQDGFTRRAVERSYAIISEAAVKLGSDAEHLVPEIPWADIRGLRNLIRHDYGEIDYQTLWEILDSDLEELRRGCRKALALLSP
ncbi:HepT-like ribonuclease domain-containing protein [Parvularcula maris]|uniref:DUF86 domain-containing protein n=1 Tax=Parvularcula maris TaxID=2965077 RepID=A0A9X2LAP4_9PROT|nr:HepT-like ribonuclease domain-containing protein [Parvularcula maris]MCQ8186162.1 DUF86 domain-containing protein [Parvularcula maris]